MHTTGHVYLVGAGPGDPELLTVKAVRLLGEVDVVVYDRLVSEQVLAMVPDGVSRIFVGKASGRHVLPQDEINRLVASLALAGHDVVRLKGGDPFVFGRGGEEALYLRGRGIPFSVVPGVSAAMACAAYAGIPVTHRGVASGVQLVAGHCRGTKTLELDWQALAHPQLTLVFYMGLANLEQIRDGLRGAGRAAATPVAVVENGTLASQRRLVTRLDTMVHDVTAAAIGPPAVVIVGDVVRLAAQLDWFGPGSETAPQRIAAGARHG
jgi:uroporphyrin-III C-methyltransferase/precorrin-2 dehydrogenase/sirohydrochlorin ferrochelatase/uroporphyrin-III C-methyltransferase